MSHLEKTLWGLASAAILALAGWVYTAGARVAAVETKAEATSAAVQDIRQDVRDLRNALLGPKH